MMPDAYTRKVSALRSPLLALHNVQPQHGFDHSDARLEGQSSQCERRRTISERNDHGFAPFNGRFDSLM
jgi:hypothetical protein